MDSVNKWLTFVANLGVIAGIVFFGIELRQNNQLLQLEAITAFYEGERAYNTNKLLNEDLIAMQIKNDNKEPLTEIELRRTRAIISNAYSSFRTQYLLFQRGIISEDNLRNSLLGMKRFITVDTTYSPMDYWLSSNYSLEFTKFWEECVIADCESIPR